MKTNTSFLLIALAIILPIGKVAAQTDTERVKQTLSKYNAALEKLDVSGTEVLFTSGSQIVESGSVEGTYKEYQVHHIGPELSEFKSFAFSGYKADITVDLPYAFATQTYKYTIVLKKDNSTIERIGVATSVLKRIMVSGELCKHILHPTNLEISVVKSEGKYIPALKYDWLTGFYDAVVNLTMPEKQFKKELVNQAWIKKDLKVFGCGSLTLSIMAAEMEPGAHYYALDVDEKILAIATEKLKSTNKRIDIQQYDGTKLPYEENSFDRVISSLVFHHLTPVQKENSSKEIFRILRPQGELHIADWGKAKNRLMRTALYAVQLLDGFETTTDNVLGQLPIYLTQPGFSQVSETRTYRTIFGTLSLFKAVKPVN